ncbi:MAG: P-loop NTPase family protein [Leptolyngbya sp. SIO4C1]|nr:P-loop NTPase family protein [Leptolyngbya sp. SIO4C1]
MVSQLSAVNVSPASPSVSPSGSAKVLRHPFLQAIEGTVQVFTSPHRSFFTNVMVQALRSAEQGRSVLIVQFLRGGINQGPSHPTQMGQNLDWIRCGYAGCITEATRDRTAAAAVTELWQHTRLMIEQASYGLVVLDELSLAIQYDLLPESEVLELLAARPPQLDVVLTGPQMPSAILALADQVTEYRRDFLP